MATKTTTKSNATDSTSSDETNLAALDPNQLTDSDRLYHMAQAMRDEDDLFELPVVDWEKKNKSVQVEIVTPDGTTDTVQQDWPDKPTEDNEFIRTCMCAMDIDDPTSATLMADELQDVDHDEFTVPADRDYHGWELKPSADMPTTPSERITDTCHAFISPGERKFKVLSFLLGPVATIITAIVVGLDAAERADGNDSVWSDETYAVARNNVFAFFGLLAWVGLFLLLL
jgi:hypothetical protein